MTTTELRPLTLTFMPVEIDARASENIHAGVAWRDSGRWRDMPVTICDRQGKRRVKRVLRLDTLDVVTCKQCRVVLVDEGVLEA